MTERIPPDPFPANWREGHPDWPEGPGDVPRSDYSNLTECETCFCVVPIESAEKHAAWHQAQTINALLGL